MAAAADDRFFSSFSLEGGGAVPGWIRFVHFLPNAS
jgi:hypothetical protein